MGGMWKLEVQALLLRDVAGQGGPLAVPTRGPSSRPLAHGKLGLQGCVASVDKGVLGRHEGAAEQALEIPPRVPFQSQKLSRDRL